MIINDNAQRYGHVSRVLHWGMAILILWQFLSSAAHFFLEDTALEEFMWATHKPLGFVLFVLIFIRIIWALKNISNRPGSINIAAKAGHIALYALMVIVPGLALIRQYGSGRVFVPFGILIFPGFKGDEISWMVEAGNLLHSWLGWFLLVMIFGHIFMVYWHRKSDQMNVMPRMWR